MDRSQWPQSALAPDGPAATAILDLWWVLLALSTFVVLLVTGTLLYASLRRRDYEATDAPLPISPDLVEKLRGARESPEPTPGETVPLEAQVGAAVGGRRDVRRETLAGDRRGMRWIVAGGVAFPVVTLVPLFVLTMQALAVVEARDEAPALTIEAIGRQFWWEVHYLDDAGNRVFETANEIHIPVGRTVLVRLRAADVIHSFWVPRLAGKTDMIPGRVNRLRIRADAPGIYRGQCAEYCGLQHAKMAFLVIAQPEPEFRRWAQRQALPAAAPADTLAAHGLRVFRRSGCGSCHAIRGTPAGTGDFGPDLTHLASRRTLAAVTMPNTPGHLGGWIGDPQAPKPGNLMPTVPLAREDFNALLHYLTGLR
ncbi:MAG TPA: cytochrome c oxidase subunit II [Longimicrobiales bacterium]